MALRHQIPGGFDLDVDRSSEPVKLPPVMRAPVRVGFRSGADFKGVVAAMNQSKVIEVEAAVGSGKSVRLPSHIAQVTGMPVIHVVPSELLAYDQSQYVKVVSSVDVAYHDVIDAEVAHRGVTYMSSAMAVARLLKYRKLADVDVIVFLDECHESDAYTYVLRSLVVHVQGVLHLVKASATFSLSNFRPRETEGQVEMRKYEYTPVGMWEPMDDDKPWSVGNFQGNALIFVDSKVDAEQLMVKYHGLGFSAYRLYAKMKRSDFQDAMTALRDKNGPIVVLLADYSFRSGFTFDVSLVIDTGMVACMSVQGSAPALTWRPAYELEMYQAAGRAGRLAGSSALCYSPSGRVNNAICDLEGVELDVAAVVMRLLGYAIPRPMQHSVFASGDIPKDLLHSFRDAQPLACLTPEFLVPFVVGQSSRDRVGVNEYGTREVQIPEARVAKQDSGAFRVRATAVVSSGSEGYSPTSSSLDFWEETFDKLNSMSVHGYVDHTESGKFYCAEGVSDQPRVSRGLPKGLVSLQSMMAASNFTYRFKSLRTDDQLTAIACALDRYNAITAELTALSQILQQGPLSDLAPGVRSDIRARWAKYATELVSAHVGECMTLGSVLPTMCEDISGLKELKRGMPEVVDQFVEYHVQHITYFGAGHAREVQDEYKTQFVESDKKMLGDTPVRSSYHRQRGSHGVAADALQKRITHKTTNVGRSNAMNVLSWVSGVKLKDNDGGGRSVIGDRRSAVGTRRVIDVG